MLETCDSQWSCRFLPDSHVWSGAASGSHRGTVQRLPETTRREGGGRSNAVLSRFLRRTEPNGDVAAPPPLVVVGLPLLSKGWLHAVPPRVDPEAMPFVEEQVGHAAPVRPLRRLALGC